MATLDARPRDMGPHFARMEASQQFKLLNPLVQPHASVADALQENDKLTSTAATSDSALASHLWDLFSAILEIANRTAPAQQAHLVEFLDQLRRKNLTSPTTGETVKYHGLNIWADLPSFSWAAREGWNIDAWSPSLTAEQTRRWENRNAFLAQLTTTGKGESPLDFSLFGLWVLRQAFEDDPPADAANTTVIRAACLWYIHAGERLWANVKDNRALPEKTGIGGKKYLDKTWTGYNLERWAIWEKGLEEAACADEVTKQMVAEAQAHIKRVTAE